MAYEYVIEASAKGSGTWGLYDKWQEPTHSTCMAVQAALKIRDRYTGPIDGAWGPNTIKGIQQSIKAGGFYSGPVDGAVGANTVIGVNRYAYKGSSWDVWFDGKDHTAMGTNPERTWQAFVRGLRMG